MALNDLISQAKKSKLGRAISNVVSKADRDKSLAGFQIVPGGISGGVNRVKQSFKTDPGQYSITRGFSNIVPTTQAVLSPINYLKRQAPSQFAQDVSYGLRGASQLTPFQAVNSLGLDKIGQQQYQSTAPTTDRQRTAQQIGRSTYGLALTAPLGGANMVRNVAGRTVAGTVTGAGIGAGISAVTGGDIKQGAKQGALSGYSFAPLGAITNPLTQKALVGVPSVLQNQIGQRAIGGVANVIEDEIQGLIDGYDTDTKSRVTSLVLGAVLTGNEDALKSVRTKLSSMGIKNADDIITKAKSRLPEGARNLKFEIDGQEYDKVMSKSDASDWTAYLQSKGIKYELTNLGQQGGYAQFGDTQKPPAIKDTSQPKTQLEETISKIKPEKVESSRQKILTKKTQQQKGQLFREAKPVSGGSKIQAIKGEMVKASPSKVSSDISISRNKKYAFNINKKKLGLNAEQSKELDNVTEVMRPVLEGNKGKTLTKNEIIEGGRKAKVLEDVVGRDEAKQFAESLQASRNLLRSEQSQVGITPKFLEQLEIVSSVAADAGRRLQAFNIGAEDITIKEKLLRDILKTGATADEVLKAGRKVDWDNAKEVTDFYRKFKPATLAEKLDEYRYTNMLSSPNTHINNTFSNFMQTAVLAPIEKSIRGAVSFAEARLTGKEQEYFARQGVDYAKGYWKALPDAWGSFTKTISGQEGLTKPDVDFIPTSTSKLRQLYTTPLRMLEASDQFFRTLVKGGEIESLKTQGIMGAKASKIAEQQADYRTFRQAFDPEGKLGQNKVLQIWDKWNSVISNLRNAPGGKYLVPFLQTPTNILKQGVEYSPLGFTTVPGAKEPLTQLSKAIVGSTVFTGAYALASSGLTTWDTPTNSNERAEFYAAGLQPYSIKVGDKWVSYSKLGPLAYPIAMASALKWSQENGADEDFLKNMGKTMAGTLGFFADQSYVRGIGDMIDAVRGDDYKQSRALSNIPAQMIPYRSFMGWIARQVDPVYRKTSGGTVPEQIGKSLISQIPFASKSLEAYQTPFGTDSQRQFPGINAVSPFSISQEKPKELEYYNARNQVRQENKKVDKILKDIESGKPVDTSKVMTDQVISLTKKKIEAGIEVTDQELETAYLNKVISMPSSNRYEKGMRDSELWTKTGTILADENLSDTQKTALTDKLATELGVTKEDIQLYQVAKQDNAPKTLYILDQVETMQSPDEILQFLVKSRKPVNGKILASDGVIDNLVDDGIIPYQLGKDLKKLDFNDDGTAKTKKTSGGSKGGSKSKKDPYAIAYKNYLENLSNITLPSGKIRTQAPIKINVKGLTFSD